MTEIKMEKQRLLYIDQLRGIVMLMVVFQHLENYLTTSLPQIDKSMGVLGNFRMPLFFFVSGYIINKVTKIENRKKLFKFYTKKAINLLIPTIVWTLIVNNIFFSNSLNIPTYIDIIECFSSDGHLWFLTTLFYFMLVVGVYRWAIYKEQKILSIIILISAFVSFCFLYAEFGLLKKCTLYAPYFFGGLLISSYKQLEQIIRNDYLYIGSLLIFCCISGYWISGETSTFNIGIRLISAITAIITLYNIVIRIHWNAQIDKLIRLIGVNTLSIYVAHWYFLGPVNVSPNWILAFLQLTFYSIIISLVCVGIDKLLCNMRFFRFLFYGKTK